MKDQVRKTAGEATKFLKFFGGWIDVDDGSGIIEFFY
jgi:hypothetical protein